jgi:hypothetical protein
MGHSRIIAVHTPYSLKAVDPTTGQDGRGKKPGSEPVLDPNGNKVIGSDGTPVFTNWRVAGHSAWFLNRATHPLGNTGLVLGGQNFLIAVDIDSNKKASPIEREAFAVDAFHELVGGVLGPAIRQGLIRLRFPGSLAVVMRSDGPMTKQKVMGQRGAVEILAEGQHLVVHGDHPDVAEHGQARNWHWRRNRTPWNAPISQYPIVLVADIEAALDQLKRSGVLGVPITPPSARGGHASSNPRSTRYPATDRLNELFQRHNGLVKPAVRELIDGTVEGERHDTIVAVCGRLVFQNWAEERVHDLLIPAINANPQFVDFNAIEEITKAFNHARGKDLARAAKARGGQWPRK